jgi:pimeloyl-ACP methyl ester carboxylesterase
MKVRLASAAMHRLFSSLRGLMVWLLSFWAVSALNAAAAEISIDRGEIAGALYAVARPAKWNGRLLLLAHGFRPVDRPKVADLFPEHGAYRELLDNGWMVAKSSFRRNGIIVTDAISDLNALRDYIEKTYGVPKTTILEGESMGGLIVTLMCERDPAHYSGAVAIGAALKMDEPGENISPTGKPGSPLLFLTNQSELEGPTAYVAQSSKAVATRLAPTLFRVSRDGHVNVNQAERSVALRALIQWIDSGRETLPGAAGTPFDATTPPQPVASKVRMLPDHAGFETKVIEVSGVYGNVAIDAQPADFASAGIAPQSWFELEAHGKTYRTFYGSDFGSVKVGEWVVFPNADGFYWLSRNFADAAGTAGIQYGDTLTIRPAGKK